MYILGNLFFNWKNYLTWFTSFQSGTIVSIVEKISVGSVYKAHAWDNCCLGKDMKMYGNGSVIIGNNVDITLNVCFYWWLWNRKPKKKSRCWLVIQNFHKKQTLIWQGRTFINSIAINESVVIGMGSVVNNNFVYAGNLAKVVRKLKF